MIFDTFVNYSYQTVEILDNSKMSKTCLCIYGIVLKVLFVVNKLEIKDVSLLVLKRNTEVVIISIVPCISIFLPSPS